MLLMSDKRKRLRDAAAEAAREFREEGKAEMATQLEEAINSLPLRSAATLYDILKRRR